MMPDSFGRMLMVTGGILLAAGAFLEYGGELPFSLGKLPGDINIEGEKGSFHFPIVTCIVISILLNVLMSLFR